MSEQSFIQKEAVDDTIRKYQEYLGERLHSVYVLGSVARGNPLEGISDLDTLAVVTDAENESDSGWFGDFRQKMREEYPFISEVSLEVVSRDDIRDNKFLRVMIKLEGACVYGEDLAHELPDMQPGEDTRISIPQTTLRMKRAREALEMTEDEEDIKSWCRAVTRRMIRSGYELVEEEERVYTRELEKCYEGFAKHYPEQAILMQRALELTRNPTGDKEQVKSLLATLGEWLVEEIHRKFPDDTY